MVLQGIPQAKLTFVIAVAAALSGCAPTAPKGGNGSSGGALPWASGGLKMGYIRSDVISQKYPDYRDADNTLRTDNRKWQAEAERSEQEIIKKQAELEELSLILSEERKKELESEIAKMRTDLQKFRHETWYAENSTYVKRRRELMEPIDARMNDAIWKVAEDMGLDVVFDTVEGNIVFAKPGLDITDLVLEELQR